MSKRNDILDLWRIEPDLIYSGFCTDRAQLKQGRRELLNALVEVQLCVDWLQLQEWGQRVTPNSPSSYSLKHAVERAVGHYIGNGCLIAAAILLGVPYMKYSGSPNAAVAIKRTNRKRALLGSGFYGYRLLQESYT